MQNHRGIRTGFNHATGGHVLAMLVCVGVLGRVSICDDQVASVNRSFTIIRWAIASDDLLANPGSGSESVGTVSKGTMLAVFPIRSAVVEERTFIFVKPIGVTSQKPGWISYASTAISPSLTTEHGNSQGRKSSAVSGMPILIQRLPEPQREDWRRLSAAITDAESDGVFVPDAYVARAELWTIAGDAGRAVEDFRKAADTALRAGRTQLEYSAYLRLLRDALGRLEEGPRPAEGSQDDDFKSANAHYAAGFHLFWRESFSQAESEFESAIALNPTDPRFWYFRGLCRRRLGNSKGAKHDVLMGAFLERSRPRNRTIDTCLSRVQGRDRFWLEEFRKGDPSQRLLQFELAGIDVRPGGDP